MRDGWQRSDAHLFDLVRQRLFVLSRIHPCESVGDGTPEQEERDHNPGRKVQPPAFKKQWLRHGRRRSKHHRRLSAGHELSKLGGEQHFETPRQADATRLRHAAAPSLSKSHLNVWVALCTSRLLYRTRGDVLRNHKRARARTRMHALGAWFCTGALWDGNASSHPVRGRIAETGSIVGRVRDARRRLARRRQIGGFRCRGQPPPDENNVGRRWRRYNSNYQHSR